MGWLADAHSEWHAVNGRNEVCPLDCGATEGLYDQYEMDQEARECDNAEVEHPGFPCDHPAPTEEQMWEDPWRDWSATEPPF